jgi:hypothetical protein
VRQYLPDQQRGIVKLTLGVASIAHLSPKQLKERGMALRTPVIVKPKTVRDDMPLAATMRDIRIWLDSERIEPVEFKAVVGRVGLGFEISFRDEHEAERFQERFASLLP